MKLRTDYLADKAEMYQSAIYEHDREFLPIFDDATDHVCIEKVNSVEELEQALDKALFGTLATDEITNNCCYIIDAMDIAYNESIEEDKL